MGAGAPVACGEVGAAPQPAAIPPWHEFGLYDLDLLGPGGQKAMKDLLYSNLLYLAPTTIILVQRGITISTSILYPCIPPRLACSIPTYRSTNPCVPRT